MPELTEQFTTAADSAPAYEDVARLTADEAIAALGNLLRDAGISEASVLYRAGLLAGRLRTAAPKLVYGRDAAQWCESYELLRDSVVEQLGAFVREDDLLRDSVVEHLGAFVREDDAAEEGIIVDAIESAGVALLRIGALERALADSYRRVGCHQHASCVALDPARLEEIAAMLDDEAEWNPPLSGPDRKAVLHRDAEYLRALAAIAPAPKAEGA